ncbi:hypothetical protein L1D14_20510 [Vibrio tubiashii]|uniref:hypothetical protein n=1 Tax=Vibrio tubiashii TaxID=29498 RepID=UPI001EFC881F|nr:hypothetical protein [Vibrio tubiashii]MCG9578604.1 hypothetical protein [Vibrio tubiashii]
MKFSNSVGALGVVSHNLDLIVINSSAARNPESVQNFEDFLSTFSKYHEPSIDNALKELVHNHNQPIFDFNEIKVQHEQQIEIDEIAESLSIDNEIEL